MGRFAALPESRLASTAFRPPAGLANSHAQSILASFPLRKRGIARQAATLTSSSVPQILTSAHGVRLLGFYSQAPSRSRGLAVLLHGWEGSAQSHYLLSTAVTLQDAGLDIFRLNFRDHGSTQHLNEGLFHSCRIDEVVDAIKSIQDHYAARPLFLVGWSLGGNFALRVAVRARRSGINLTKVVAICPVIRPHSTMKALETGLWAYRHYYLRKWRRSLAAKEALYPDTYQLGDLRRLPTLTATTEFFVDRYTELPDLDSYLAGYALTGPLLSELPVPARLIATADDPIIPIGDLDDVYSSELLDVTVTARGGHCAFLVDYRLSSWVDGEILRALVDSEANFPAPPAAPRI